MHTYTRTHVRSQHINSTSRKGPRKKVQHFASPAGIDKYNSWRWPLRAAGGPGRGPPQRLLHYEGGIWGVSQGCPPQSWGHYFWSKHGSGEGREVCKKLPGCGALRCDRESGPWGAIGARFIAQKNSLRANVLAASEQFFCELFFWVHGRGLLCTRKRGTSRRGSPII